MVSLTVNNNLFFNGKNFYICLIVINCKKYINTKWQCGVGKKCHCTCDKTFGNDKIFMFCFIMSDIYFFFAIQQSTY